MALPFTSIGSAFRRWSPQTLKSCAWVFALSMPFNALKRHPLIQSSVRMGFTTTLRLTTLISGFATLTLTFLTLQAMQVNHPLSVFQQVLHCRARLEPPARCTRACMRNTLKKVQAVVTARMYMCSCMKTKTKMKAVVTAGMCMCSCMHERPPKALLAAWVEAVLLSTHAPEVEQLSLFTAGLAECACERIRRRKRHKIRDDTCMLTHCE